MNAEEDIRNLSFYDGVIQSVKIEPDEVTGQFKSWQERTFDLRFSKVAFVKVCTFGGDISEVKMTSDREVLLTNLTSMDLGWDNDAIEWPCKLMQIDVSTEEIVFTAVFEELEITELD